MDSEYCLLREEQNLVRKNSQHILVFHTFGGSQNHGPPRTAGPAEAVTAPLVSAVFSCNKLTPSVISVPLIRGVTSQVIVFWVVTPCIWRDACLSDYKVSHRRRRPLYPKISYRIVVFNLQVSRCATILFCDNASEFEVTD